MCLQDVLPTEAWSAWERQHPDREFQLGYPEAGGCSNPDDLHGPMGARMKEKAVISWSGGKDSALALHEAQKDFEIVALLTTVTEEYDRISVHGVRTSLLERQAHSLNCALDKVFIPPTCSNDDYETKTRAGLDKYRRAGVLSVICGDIFLEDVRRYREKKLFTGGLKGVFPLWGTDTTELARQFIAQGFQAILCCVDTNVINQEFSGRLYDHEMLRWTPTDKLKLEATVSSHVGDV